MYEQYSSRISPCWISSGIPGNMQSSFTDGDLLRVSAVLHPHTIAHPSAIALSLLHKHSLSTHPHAHTLFLPLSLTHSDTHKHSLSLAHTFLSLSLSLKHTHTPTSHVLSIQPVACTTHSIQDPTSNSIPGLNSPSFYHPNTYELNCFQRKPYSFLYYS